MCIQVEQAHFHFKFSYMILLSHFFPFDFMLCFCCLCCLLLSLLCFMHDVEGMNEDGSFIGLYGKQKKQGETSSGGFATLV